MGINIILPLEVGLKLYCKASASFLWLSLLDLLVLWAPLRLEDYDGKQVFLLSVNTLSGLIVIRFLSESIGVTSLIRLVFERNSTPTSQVAFLFHPVGLGPCSPQTAPLSPPRGVLPLTD